MRAPEERLRGCPTCGSNEKADKMGLRDYSTWLYDLLPGRVGGTDIDCIIDQEASDRALVLELKPSRYIPRGQSRLFDRLSSKGFDVWVVVDTGFKDDLLELCIWRPYAPAQVWRKVSVEQFRQSVKRWWDLGDEEAA